MVKHMNKRGVTILELLISIALISVVILMLVFLMFSLEKIINDTSYASQ
ncbi:MAG: prepilin-type N-terminal cleavage/methylation domain-containing protein, partial [Bacilli bacterium]|nr:prepilin-type N-terminal cleavage/methylation domain-containing protein [Bacilli bacterium]